MDAQGRLRALLARARPRNAGPAPDGLVGRQSFLDALLETIEVGIVSCDADGVFVVSNRAERAMFGLSAGLDGREMAYLDERIDVYAPDGRRLRPEEYPLMRALRGEDVSNLDVLAGPAGGPYRELAVRGRQITGPGGELLGAVAALTDVTAEREATRQLAEEHRRLNEAQRVGQLGSFEYDFATDRWSFSDHFCVLWGLEPDDTGPSRLLELMAEEDRPLAVESWRRACRSGRTESCELRVRRASDGAERVIRSNVEIELDLDGRPRHGRGTHLDITDVTTAEQQARQANAFFRAILAASPDFTFVVEAAGGAVIYQSPGTGVLGLAGEQLAAGGFARLLARAEDRHRLEEAMATAGELPDGEVLQVQYRALHADGRRRWISQRVTPFRRDPDGRVVELLVVARDVTEVVDAEEQLVRAARHDYLTGLANRALLVERLDSALRTSLERQREVAVLFCDLDGFKRVNDDGGHAAGDAVLVEIARRLVGVVRDEDVVARVGGAEFVIVVEPWNREMLRHGTQPAETSVRELAVQVAERVTGTLRRPVTVGASSFLVTASIGIAYAGPGNDAEADESFGGDAVLHRADTAMYRAKERGKDRFEICDPLVDALSDERSDRPVGAGSADRPQ